MGEMPKFKAFVLAYALNISDNYTFDLLQLVFDQVYDDALNDNLDYESWKWIEVHTKSLLPWQEWDKCKKLRNLIVDKFIEFNWKIEKMDFVISNFDLRKELKNKYNKRKK